MTNLSGCRHLRGRRTAGTKRGGAWLGVLLLTVSIAAPPLRSWAADGGADQAPTEYQVKAAFLYNFARFVEWPPRAFTNPTAPLGVCVLGEDPFGEALDRAVLGKSSSDRALMVRRGRKLQELGGCAILFISASERGRLPEIFDELRTAPVLTVGECENFAAHGGGVQFTLEDNHVHFIINVDATERAGLKLSSKLLSLAHVVHEDSARKKG